MNNENKNNLFNTENVELSAVNGNIDDENITLSSDNNTNTNISLIDEASTYSYSCCEYPTNTSMGTAREISDKGYTEGNLYSADIEQWFKFTATKTAEYTICTYSSLDTIGTLYSDDGKLLYGVDDYEDCGKIDFRIIYELIAGRTYYIKVRSKGDIGSYLLRVTDAVLAECVYINKSSITLAKGVVYELPITPYNSYNYKGYNGAQKIPGLDVLLGPPDANEQDIWWWTAQNDVLECSYGWDDDGDRYIHVTAKEVGTSKLYAIDWKEDGKRDYCGVNVVQYCGGSNYRDVTHHSLVFQEDDGYYVCSKCGYRVKSPAIQDKDILSKDDYLKMIATMHYFAHNDLLAEKIPISAYFYNSEAQRCKIVMDTIRSKPEYAELYEYQGPNGKYLADETDETIASFVIRDAINWITVGSYNGFYETIASTVVGYYCPTVGMLSDIISLLEDTVKGKIDAISFGAFLAGLSKDMKGIAMALNIFSSASDIIDCDVIVGDPIVRIAYSAYACAEYIFDINYNIKKVIINYSI